MFCSRTSEYWSSEVVRIWRESSNNDNNAILSEKDLKRQGFGLAEIRSANFVFVIGLIAAVILILLMF